MLENTNLLAAFVAALSVFVLGGIWYSPMMFGNVWKREAGVNAQEAKKTHQPIVFAVSFLSAFIAAIAFGNFLGMLPPFNYAIQLGLIIGVGWVATSFSINYLFAGRNIKLLLIDAGYHVVQFILYGIIFGLWH